ncbi:MAG TPA: hypothetical protein VGE34_01105 [Candidatus Saccharimonadales bacterium]
MIHKLSKVELVEAQIALFVAVLLQFVVWLINDHIFSVPQYILIAVELALALSLGFATSVKSLRERTLHHTIATLLIGLISLANIASLAVVIYALIVDGSASGFELLGSALAIFATNVIVYALWYWEIDSPGLTNRRWTKSDKDFQFTQQSMPQEFPDWRPEFIDYLYISAINSVNGATTSAHPLTRQAKMLMATQAMISIFTLALVIARSVSILGS